MIRDQNVPDASLEEIFLYQNIRSPRITKAATCSELFPFLEVIVQILPQEKSYSRIISNVKGESFASFTLAYIVLAYKLPLAQVMMKNDWIKGVNIDPLECAKKMIMPGKQLRQKTSGEYESPSLRTPFKIIALMFNIIFG